MDRSTDSIYIIGAGVSGLVAARTLENKGFAPIILERSGSVGGRVKTDRESGLVYDHGFQVLLTAYPQARKHLDFGTLNLKQFRPGALIFSGGKSQFIGDPLRDLSSFIPTLGASVGSLKDKWKIFQLSARLKRKSIEAIFTSPEKETFQYLRDLGFSDRVIHLFFKPFFGGIFLEEALNTSSRMFEFTFKMFSQGYAAIPQDGIGSIAEQLVGGLVRTKIQFNQTVSRVTPESIVFEDGTTLPSDATLITVPYNAQTGELRDASVAWERCDNLYFTVAQRSFSEGVIGLVADTDALINNLYYPFDQQVEGKPVLSVTVVKQHSLSPEGLIEKVKEDLERYCGLNGITFLKHYPIEKALPRINNLEMDPLDSTQSNMENVFLAGDYLLNGSLNAAMASGEAAAESLVRKLA